MQVCVLVDVKKCLFSLQNSETFEWLTAKAGTVPWKQVRFPIKKAIKVLNYDNDHIAHIAHELHFYYIKER